MKQYSEQTINVVDEIIEIADVRGLIEHAVQYVSVYKDGVIDFVFDNIEDSEELYPEEREYLIERITEIIEEII